MNVGIIGFGGAGFAHLYYFRCVPGCEVTRVYDPKPAGRERATREGVPRVCSTLEEFWDGLDAVSVCTPDETHADYIVAALARNLQVICEKPLTDSVDGIRRILEAEKTSNGTLAVQHQMRFVPLYQRMKAALENEELGTVSYLEGYYIHDLMVYCGCHFVDLLRWFTEEEPQEVFASANNRAFADHPEADLTVAVMRFPSSILGKVLVSIGTAGPQDHSVRVYGDRASIDNAALFDRDGEWKRTLHKPMLVQRKLLRDRRRWWRELPRQLEANIPARAMSAAFNALRRVSPPPGAQYGPRHFPVRLYEHRLACVCSIEDFVDAARTDRPPRVTAQSSAQTVLACLAALESSRTNKMQRVDRLETVS